MKRLISLILAAVLLLPLTGCAGGKSGMDFTAILPQDISTLDPQTASGPASAIVIGSIFEGLCRIGSESEILPGVAERWEHNKDHTEFTFHLRAAKWSNGESVTAEDFVFAVVRALSPDTGAAALDDLFLIKNAKAFYAGEVEEDSLGIRAENDRTLVVSLESGYPDFPALTAGNHYMPCSRAYFEESAGHYGLSAEYLLTNGPFTFPHIYAWNTDYNEKSISLVRSDTYRGEHRTDPSSLTYLIDYDSSIDSDPLNALSAGSADILELSEADAREAEAQGCGVLALDDAVTGLLLNPQADSLSYIGTRELFVKTLDREILLALGGGKATEAARGIVPGCVLWDGEAYYGEADACYAQQDDSVTESIPSLLQLLKLEKVPSITVLCADDERSIAVANGFLSSWNSKLGNAFNIQPLPESELKSRVAQGDYEAALYTLRAGGSVPFSVLAAFESSSIPTLLNDPDFDSALHSMDFSLSAHRELELSVQESYVFYPLFSAKTYYALAPGVGGVAVTPDQRIDFSTARKK